MTTQRPTQARNRIGDPQPVGDAVVDAVRAALREHPGMVRARVVEQLVTACPEISASWCVELVAGAVAEGRVPEADVTRAVWAYRRRLAMPVTPDLGPIRDRAAYLSSLLRRALGQHGIPWRASSGRRDAPQTAPAPTPARTREGLP